MRIYVNIIFILLLHFTVWSQSIERHIISTTGGFTQNNIGSLSFTVGEPVVILGANGSEIITQGFQQPNIAASLPVVTDCKFKFYPNPTRQIISIETSISETTFEVFDVLGRSYGFFNKVNGEMDVSFLSAGIYFIKVNCDVTNEFYRKFIKV